MFQRPRRNRKSESVRNLVRETNLTVQDLILPLFVCDGVGVADPVSTMPGVFRYSTDKIIEVSKEARDLGIPAIALFPVIEDSLKDKMATESVNQNGLLQRSIAALKESIPELTIISDVAMDPYSSDGHDGILEDGQILNDASLEILANMALAQAQAGADIVAPSDMMDCRVGVIRDALDSEGFLDVSIMAYSAKYASAFYGPFRDALDSAPKSGDKKTYQMDPANRIEAKREVQLDIDEGADFVMIKPALAYLDVISDIKAFSSVPVAAYNVSGEYSAIKAAGQLGYLDEKAAMFETLTSIKRAGADIILSYFSMEAARELS